MSTFILHVRPKLRGSSDIRWKSTANKSELMQQQQDCKADVGVGDALLGGGKSGRMTMLGSLARIEMEAMEGVRRCNDRRTNRLEAAVGKGTGSQKVERLRTKQQPANEDQKRREKTAS